MFSIITRANLIHCFTAENAFLKVDWLPIPELRFNQSCTLNTCTGTSSKEIDKVAGGKKNTYFLSVFKYSLETFFVNFARIVIKAVKSNKYVSRG